MKVEDNLYIRRGDVVLSITIEAWKTITGEAASADRPGEASYPDEAKEFAEALNDVCEVLAELDESGDDQRVASEDLS